MHFATCERRRALGFLQSEFEKNGHAITDTPESAGPLLDLVEKDVFRICDPNMHGQAGIIGSTNFNPDSSVEALRTALKNLPPYYGSL